MAKKKQNADLTVVVTETVVDRADALKRAVAVAGKAARSAGKATSGAVGRAASAAGTVGSGVALAVGDLNGDGKIDEADLEIAKRAVGATAKVAAREAADLGKVVARHDLTKDAAAGAAVGALIAIPVPFVGPMAGAAVGAAFGVARGTPDLVGTLADGVASAIKSRKPRRRAPRKPA